MDKRPSNGYPQILQIVLLVVAAAYCIGSLLAGCCLILSLAKRRLKHKHHHKANHEHNDTSGGGPEPTTLDESDETSRHPRSQSGVYKSSKAIPITVTIPSLSNSSIVSQGFLDSLVPDMLGARSRTPNSGGGSSSRQSPPQPTLKVEPVNPGQNNRRCDVSKSLKLSEYRPADTSGRTSIV